MSVDAGEDDQGSSATAVKIQVRGDKDGKGWDDGVYSDVKRLLIQYDDDWIRSVQILYIDKNGEPTWSSQHGGGGSSTSSTRTEVDLDYPNEYLTSIHGYLVDNQRWGGIKSLTFETNTRTCGPYGEEKGTKFSIPIMGAKIVGFHGWSDSSSLNAIGVYVQPITKSIPLPKPTPKPKPKPQPQPLGEHFSLGQYGREDGECWVETFRAIKRLVIYSDDEWIISIQMEYEDENGKLVLSKKHGGDGGSLSEIVFEYPDEHLLTINGYYDDSYDSKSATNMIRSLTVITNKNRTHGPFGVEKGTEFLFPTDDCLKVVGIHGRSDLYLNAIGLHVANVF